MDLTGRSCTRRNLIFFTLIHNFIDSRVVMNDKCASSRSRLLLRARNYLRYLSSVRCATPFNTILVPTLQSTIMYLYPATPFTGDFPGAFCSLFSSSHCIFTIAAIRWEEFPGTSRAISMRWAISILTLSFSSL